MVAAEHTSEILGEEFQKDGTVVPGSALPDTCCSWRTVRASTMPETPGYLAIWP